MISLPNARLPLLGAGLALLTACGDLLDVTNPGPIADADLDTPAAMPALVAGMSGDLSSALSTTVVWGSVWSDDLRHSGTLGAPTIFARGDIEPVDVNPWWGPAHRARWVAEHGIERMTDVLGASFESNPLAARAYLLAGFANRILGENVCEAVFDGGSPQPYTVHFERAEEQFTEALRLAQGIGAEALATAARAGRASVRLGRGDWAGAVADAVTVPLDFRYDAVFSQNTGRESNGWEGVTLTRGEYTVWSSPYEDRSDDPRVPSEPVLGPNGQVRAAANGSTPWIRQQKYLSNADEIALAKGTEMVLIRAEAALRAGDVTEAVDLINQGRAHEGLPPVAAATVAEAWPILHYERGATLWLEGRRFFDLRRWFEESGPAHHDFLADRDRCVPISEDERLSNPNVS
jgi:hypothetical protein